MALNSFALFSRLANILTDAFVIPMSKSNKAAASCDANCHKPKVSVPRDESSIGTVANGTTTLTMLRAQEERMFALSSINVQRPVF